MESFSLIELDCIGIIILLLIYVNQHQSGEKSLDQTLYNRGLLYTLLILCIDVIMMQIENSDFFFMRGLNILLASLYFALMPVVGYYWLCYADYRMYGYTHATRKRKAVYRLILLVDLVVVLINLWEDWLFHIDLANAYHKGLYVIFYLLLTFLYFLFASFLAIRKARHTENDTERTEFRVLALFSVPPLLGGFIQYLAGGLPLIWIGIVISFLIVHMWVQNRYISTDALTGLNNHHQLKRYLEWKITEVEPSEKLYAIVLDIDDFKAINTAYGRYEGNNALIRTADILRACCSSEFMARYAGDEFAIICERENPERVNELIDRVQRYVNSVNRSKLEDYAISYSIGFSVFGNTDTGSVKEFINAAYQDMYRNKKEKKAGTAK